MPHFIYLAFKNFRLIVVTYMTDEEYVRRQLREAQEESGDSMKSLRWDGASLRKVKINSNRSE